MIKQLNSSAKPNKDRLMCGVKGHQLRQRLKKGKTMIPPGTTELETKERHKAHVLTVLHRT